MPPNQPAAHTFKEGEPVRLKDDIKLSASWAELKGRTGSVVKICTGYRADSKGNCTPTDQPNGYIEVLFTADDGTTRRLHAKAEDFEPAKH